MSRIDEAIRRVASSTVAEGHGDDGPLLRAPRRHEDASLDNYPAEGVTPSSVEVRRPAPLDSSRVVPPLHVVEPSLAERRASLEAASDGRLAVGSVASPIAVEQYRRLAGVLHDLQVERDLKTLMVTSALPREGKTLTVVNLALTLSDAYARRVLLIDADLRRPSVHEVLKLPNTRGLSEVLRSERSELPLRQVSPHLTVLTSGRAESSPMALLTSERMQRLLDEAAPHYDWVLLDAAPIGHMPDASILARMTRAVLFVISAGVTPYQLVMRATTELGRDCIVGTVLNRIADENIPATAYYHDYYGGHVGA